MQTEIEEALERLRATSVEEGNKAGVSSDYYLFVDLDLVDETLVVQLARSTGEDGDDYVVYEAAPEQFDVQKAVAAIEEDN